MELACCWIKELSFFQLGDPKKLLFVDSTPISADMFQVKKDILDYYESDYWEPLTVAEDEGLRRVHGLLNPTEMLNGSSKRNKDIEAIQKEYDMELCFD